MRRRDEAAQWWRLPLELICCVFEFVAAGDFRASDVFAVLSALQRAAARAGVARDYTRPRAPMTFGRFGSGAREMREPCGVACLSDGSFVVTEMMRHVLLMFDADGRYLRSIGGCEQAPRFWSFHCPSGIAFDAARDHIIVADRGNHCVVVLRRDGTFVRCLGVCQQLGAKPGLMNGPSAVAVDASSGRIVVADTFNHRVQVFDSDGQVVRCFGKWGAERGQLGNPCCVAVCAADGAIIVGDDLYGRVQMFSEDGVFVRCIGEAARLREPCAVAIDGGGHVVVVDRKKCRVRVFYRHSDAPVWDATPPLRVPRAVAVAADGAIVVTDADAYSEVARVVLL